MVNKRHAFYSVVFFSGGSGIAACSAVGFRARTTQDLLAADAQLKPSNADLDDERLPWGLSAARFTNAEWENKARQFVHLMRLKQCEG